MLNPMFLSARKGRLHLMHCYKWYAGKW